MALVYCALLLYVCMYLLFIVLSLLGEYNTARRWVEWKEMKWNGMVWNECMHARLNEMGWDGIGWEEGEFGAKKAWE